MRGAQAPAAAAQIAPRPTQAPRRQESPDPSVLRRHCPMPPIRAHRKPATPSVGAHMRATFEGLPMLLRYAHPPHVVDRANSPSPAHRSFQPGGELSTRRPQLCTGRGSPLESARTLASHAQGWGCRSNAAAIRGSTRSCGVADEAGPRRRRSMQGLTPSSTAPRSAACARAVPLLRTPHSSAPAWSTKSLSRRCLRASRCLAR